MMESRSGSPRTDLHAIAVNISSQHLGAAQSLLAAVVEHARSCASTEVRLVVAEGNVSGRNLFRRAGFEDLGRAHGRFPNGQQALEMQKPIPPIT